MGEGERLVRRIQELWDSSSSVDELMAATDGLLDPEIEWVNPPDAIERGTRKGIEGWRTALENLFGGLGSEAQFEIDEYVERGNRVFVRGRTQPGGTASGADAFGQEFGGIWTIRDGRVLRYEYRFDPEDARALFDEETKGD